MKRAGFQVTLVTTDLSEQASETLTARENHKLQALTCRFEDENIEQRFQDYIFDRNLFTNSLGLSIGFCLQAAYMILDYFSLTNPEAAIIMRLAGLAVIAAAVVLMRYTSLARYHEWLTIIGVSSFAAPILGIIAIEPTLENNYFVGLVQICVIVSFLLRVSFPKSLIPMAIILGGFAAIIQGKPSTNHTLMQPTALFTMAMLCSAGIYILERYRRSDFLKARIIKRQNSQLADMLDIAQRDQKRKLAALNMLLHVVKTPAHQISGFSDLVLSQLKSAGDTLLADQFIDSAQYIKDASVSLNANIASLLAYHQIDEIERALTIEEIHLGDLLADETDLLEETLAVKINRAVETLNADRRLVELAVRNVIHNITREESNVSTLVLDAFEDDANTVLRFIEDGERLDPETFDNAVKPLTEIANYLNADGSPLSMGLRTAARAMEVCGGTLTFVGEEANAYSLSFPRRPTLTVVSDVSLAQDEAA